MKVAMKVSLVVVLVCSVLATVVRASEEQHYHVTCKVLSKELADDDASLSEGARTALRLDVSNVSCTGHEHAGHLSHHVFATGFFAQGLEEGGNGWARLAVSSSPFVHPYNGFFGAGFLEGYATAPMIADYYENLMSGQFGAAGPSAKLVDWMQANINWTITQVEKNSGTGDPYWGSIKLLVMQVAGLQAGYTAAAAQSDDDALPALSFFDFWMMNSNGDLDDLKPAMKYQSGPKPTRPEDQIDVSPENMQRIIRDSHCSAIVKITETDAFAAHEMWSGFWQMTPIYKHYNLSQGLMGGAQEVFMSSYPAMISSEDDFYLISNGLIVMETTNAIVNVTLYEHVVPDSLLSWLRVMTANRLTLPKNALAWDVIFSPYNSGTYNNQWIVFDSGMFTPGQPVPNNTLWIVSQIPGNVVSADMSHVLNAQGYWPSYNIPYFKEIFDAAGYPWAVKTYGNVMSYSQCPRALIFARDQSSATDLVGVQKLMRENKYQTDPLAMGCPGFQLASRFDMPPSQPPNPKWAVLCPRMPFGAINGKITSVNMFNDGYQASVISGPTHQSQPVFAWSEYDNLFANVTRNGLTESYPYDWIQLSGAKIVTTGN